MHLGEHKKKLKKHYETKLNNWAKYCYFIFGNGGSATRLTRRIIESAPDVKGDPHNFINEEKMNTWDRIQARKFVVKRDSGMQSNISSVVANMKRVGINIFWIYTIRRPVRFELNGESQLLHIFDVRSPSDFWVWWDNSLLFIDPETFLAEMGRLLMLDFSGFKEKIKNPDKKWLEFHGLEN